MQVFMQKALGILEGNIIEHFWAGVAIVSAIIVIIGILKPIVFDRIKQKQLRRLALAGTDIVSSLLSTLIYFSIEGISFTNYWIGSVAVFVLSVILYWIYENTCMRDGIHKVGKYVIVRLIKILTTMNNKSEAQQELKELSADAKVLAKTAAKTAVNDKELDKL